METYRLKNIAILILLLLNLFLLLLVVSEQYGRYQAAQNLSDQTVALLQSNEISINPSLLKEESAPVAYSYSRSTEEELTFVTALLGEITVQRDSGGGTYFYSNASGSATFHSNGSFTLEISQPSLHAEDYRDFVQEYCPANYEITQIEEDGKYDTVTVTPYVDDLPVYSATIDFSFSDHYLTAASGFWVAGTAEAATDTETITKCSAAVYLMNYCNEEGKICNTITGISTGYLLQSTASVPLLLTPVYKIDTNTYSYYVNSISGHVSVAK